MSLKYIRLFNSLLEATSDENLISPNISVIKDNGSEKILMKKTDTINEPLIIEGDDLLNLTINVKPSQTCSFTYMNNTYNFISGETWEDFIDSENNTNGLFINRYGTIAEKYYMYEDSVEEWIVYNYYSVKSTDLIIDGAVYTEYYNRKCILEGSMIRLYDNTAKPIEEITYDDELLVWNFDECKLDKSKPLWIAPVNETTSYYKVTLSDGNYVNLVGGRCLSHRLFSIDKGSFEYPQHCLGDEVYTLNGPKYIVSCEEIVETKKYYNIITENNINFFANDILTSCRLSNIYPVINMKYIKLNSDIIPYESFKEYGISEKEYYGYRLGEQKDDIETIVKYVKKINECH